MRDIALQETTLLQASEYSPSSHSSVELVSPLIFPDNQTVAFERDEWWVLGEFNRNRVDKVNLIDVQTRELTDLTDLIEEPSIITQEYSNNYSGFGSSSDGRFFSFISRRSNLRAYNAVYVFDRLNQTLRSISDELDLYEASLVRDFGVSGDGTKIAFASNELLEPSLHEGKPYPDKALGVFRTYITDLVADSTYEISVRENGEPYTAFEGDHVTTCTHSDFSDDGTILAFATNRYLRPDIGESVLGLTAHYPADVFMLQVGQVAPTMVSEGLAPLEDVTAMALSGDGTKIAFATTDNDIFTVDDGRYHIYLYDVPTGTRETIFTSQASAGPGTSIERLELNQDGTILCAVAITTEYFGFINLVTRGDIWTFDIPNDNLMNITAAANDDSGTDFTIDVSADGNLVCFSSKATNLGPPDTNSVSDIYVYDRSSNSFSRESVSSGGGQLSGESLYPSMSNDARYVTFASRDSGLIASDTNNTIDVFVRVRATGNVALVSTTASGTTPEGASDASQISADGRVIVFRSYADDIVQDADPYSADIFAVGNPVYTLP